MQLRSPDGPVNLRIGLAFLHVLWSYSDVMSFLILILESYNLGYPVLKMLRSCFHIPFAAVKRCLGYYFAYAIAFSCPVARREIMFFWFFPSIEQCFFGCVGPIHWETYLREASASLRGVKGSLRGGVLFGVAYAGGYARNILSANLKKSALRQLWLLSRYLAFCGFIYFHFVLLCLPQKCLVCVAKGSMAASFIPPKTWGTDLWLGLSVAYAGLTRRLRSAYAGGAGSKATKSRRNPNPWYLKISYEKIRLRKFAYATIYHPRIRKVLTPLTQPWEFSGIALTRPLSSSLFFIFLSFQKKTLLNWCCQITL